MVSEDSKAVDTRPAVRSLGQAYLLYAASLLLVVTLGAAVQLVTVTLGLVVTELLLILAPALWFVRRKGLAAREALRLRPIGASDALLSIAVGVTGWGVAAGIAQLSIRLLGEPPPVAGLQARSLPHLLWILLCAAVLPGVCEEVLFRGVLQGVLRRRGERWAVLVTALLFAAYHLHPWIFVPALFLGIVFGTLVQRTGSLLPGILAHTATNTMAYTMLYRYGDDAEPSSYGGVMALLAAGCVITFPLAWLHTRGRHPAPPLLASVPAAAGRLLPWVVGIAGGALALAVAALLILGLLLVGVATVPGDDLEPRYHRGDRLILLEAGTLPLDLEVGDVVAFEADGGRALGILDALDEEAVEVRQGGALHRLPRSRITAKVVHVLAGPESTEAATEP